MFLRPYKKASLFCVALLLLAQTESNASPQAPKADEKQSASSSCYIDQKSGLTADDLVAYALGHNLELQAMRKEIDAAHARGERVGDAGDMADRSSRSHAEPEVRFQICDVPEKRSTC